MLRWLKPFRSSRILNLRASARGAPAIPPGIRIYAVGDIHGRADLLDEVLDGIDRHRTKARPARCIEVYLGDYVDRGRESQEVLQRLIERGAQNVPGRDLVTLTGNHEEMMLAAMDDPPSFSRWVQHGGLETLMSYGVPVPGRFTEDEIGRMSADFRRAIPRHHLRFLRSLGDSFACGDFFFVHAGVRPGIPLDSQDRKDLLWIRDEFLTSRKAFGAVVVHGHTPVRQVEIHPNRINLDTGAYVTARLSCLIIEGAELVVM